MAIQAYPSGIGETIQHLVPGGDVTVDRCGLQEGGGVRSLHWNTEESIRHAPVQVGRPKALSLPGI